MFMQLMDNATQEAKAESKSPTPIKVEVNHSLSERKKSASNSPFNGSARKDKKDSNYRNHDDSNKRPTAVNLSSDFKQVDDSKKKVERMNEFQAQASRDEKIDDEEEHNDIIFYELSEYLFDLFDANCMEEFHILNEYEEKAIELLTEEDYGNSDSDDGGEGKNEAVKEFTLEQYNLHQQFLSKFEGILENFLTENGYTIESFYQQMERKKKSIAQQHQNKQRLTLSPLEEERNSQVEEIIEVKSTNCFNVL